MRAVLWSLLVLTVTGHAAFVIANVGALFVLPFKAEWYIAAPLMTFIVWLSASRANSCPVTELENVFRRRLGLKEVRGFIGFYFLRPARRLLGLQRKRLSKESANADGRVSVVFRTSQPTTEACADAV